MTELERAFSAKNWRQLRSYDGFRYLRNDTDFLENLAIIRLTGGFVEY